jgi:hypothetical protein
VGERDADVVEPLEQPPAGVVVDLERRRQSPGLDAARLEVDDDLRGRLALDELPELLDDVLGDLRSDQACLAGVAAEDVGEAARDDNLEAVVHQRPDRMLPGRPGAEVRSRDEHGGAAVLRLVGNELGVLAPGREQAVLEAGAGHALEVDRRDDLVGVDVAAPQWQARPGVGGELLHRSSFRS